MVGEPTTFTKAWFDAFPSAVDATPLLARARALKTPQEIERMRLANEIAAAAMEHVAKELRPGMKESEAAALWQGFVHGQGTGWKGRVGLALGFSLVWSGQGIRTFTATGEGPVEEHEPTLFEIWVCADGYWCDHTKNVCPGDLDPRYEELLEALLGIYGQAIDHCRPGEHGRARRPGPRRSHGRRLCGSRAIRSRTGWARAPTSRPTRTAQAAVSSRRGWCSRSSPALTGRGGGLRVEDNFLITAAGAEKLSSYPDDFR